LGEPAENPAKMNLVMPAALNSLTVNTLGTQPQFFRSKT